MVFSVSRFVGASQRLELFISSNFRIKLTHSTVKLNRMTMPAKIIREKVILITISSKVAKLSLSTFYMLS